MRSMRSATRAVLEYASALLGAIGVVVTVVAVLSSVPGAFADEPLTGGCGCPNNGSGICLGAGTCFGSCDCCTCYDIQNYYYCRAFFFC